MPFSPSPGREGRGGGTRDILLDGSMISVRITAQGVDRQKAGRASYGGAELEFFKPTLERRYHPTLNLRK